MSDSFFDVPAGYSDADLEMASLEAAQSPVVKARRGDLIVYEVKHRDWINGEGPRERTDYEVGEVTSVTHEGRTKAVRGRYGDSTPTANIHGYGRSWLCDAAAVNVPAACEAAWANQWPSGHVGMPFASLEDVLAIVRPFKRAEAA